jgi:hypothetical protein
MTFTININGSERAIDVDGDTPVLWANRNAGITWNKAQFLDYIKDPGRRFPGPRRPSPASRTKAKPTTSGPTSRSSARTERRSGAGKTDANERLKRGIGGKPSKDGVA